MKAKKIIRQTFHKLRAFFAEDPLDPLPIRSALKGYNRSDASYDTRAALNVALLALPQGMAYAAIADLPIYFGIIASGVASVIGPFFASSRHTILGPTNATALMVFSYFAIASTYLTESPIYYMPLLVFMVGIISIIGALLRVADLLQYVSRSVLVGYLTGAALLIMNGQLKHVLGVAPQMATGEKPRTFIAGISKISHFWESYQWQTIALAVPTLIIYLVMQKRLKSLPNFTICLALSSLVAFVLKKTTGFNVPCFHAFTSDAFSLAWPPFSFENIHTLFGIAFVLAFLANLESSVMGKSLGSQTGDRPDANQDMLAVGMSNLGSAFLGSMPASGSLVRSALNFQSGAKTRFASIYSGILVLVGFFVLVKLPLVEHIPKATLAALVIGIAISLIKWKNIRICLRSTSDDAIVIIVTFLSTLLTSLDQAIFIGVAISITLFLRNAARPSLVEYEMAAEGLREKGAKTKRNHPQISIVHVEGELFFGAADLFHTQVQRTAADPNLKVIILRLKNARHLDATSVLALDDLIKHMRTEQRHVIISGATREVYKVLKKSGVLDTVLDGCDRSIGETNLFFTSPSNPNLSTRDALIRAQELLGTKEADIKIYFDPKHGKGKA